MGLVYSGHGCLYHFGRLFKFYSAKLMYIYFSTQYSAIDMSCAVIYYLSIFQCSYSLMIYIFLLLFIIDDLITAFLLDYLCCRYCAHDNNILSPSPDQGR